MCECCRFIIKTPCVVSLLQNQIPIMFLMEFAFSAKQYYWIMEFYCTGGVRAIFIVRFITVLHLSLDNCEKLTYISYGGRA